MLTGYIALALLLLNLICLIVLLLRKTAAHEPAAVPDPRLLQLPDQLTRIDARSEALDANVRTALIQLRTDLADEARRTREASASDFAVLRTEIAGSIATLGTTLNTGLAGFRFDNKASDDMLRTAVQSQLDAITHRLTAFTSETTLLQTALRESLNARLTDLMTSNTGHQTQLRTAVEERLEKLNTTNAAKLEEMRLTVDEKLHATLQTRLTESFGAVSDQLIKVHTGLGEMTLLTSGVNDLNRIFSNVKSRGGIAEVQLGRLLEQILAPAQFVRNAQVKPGTQEVVEYAVRFPGATGETLLPIDAKFPREDWERLESAHESGNPDEIATAGRAFESAIRTEGKRICGKYINEPVTTPHAIMFLPTESLYAEVVRRDGLQSDLQQNCRVTIAGPSTLSAILISFQMGFHMLNLQKKGNEVWKVLASTRTEFDKYGDLMASMEKQVGTVQNTLTKLGTRTRAINRTLRDVSEVDHTDNILSFDSVVPAIAAATEEE
jgi:DNA recombination protein RmuC